MWWGLIREGELVSTLRSGFRPVTTDFNFPLFSGLKYKVVEVHITW